MSDHSFRRAREFTLSGAVSAIAQLQNFGRPSATSALDTLTDIGQGIGANLALGDQGLGARITDFETRLDGLIETGGELEVVSKAIGRVAVVLLEWDATNTAEAAVCHAVEEGYRLDYAFNDNDRAMVERVTREHVERRALSTAWLTGAADA